MNRTDILLRLRSPDGNSLRPGMIRKARDANPVAMDVLWYAISREFEESLWPELRRLCFDRDKKAHMWCTYPHVLAARYAGIVVRRWVLFGDGSTASFVDVIQSFADGITETAHTVGDVGVQAGKDVMVGGVAVPPEVASDRTVVLRPI